MNIELSSQEYLDLLDVLHIADVVLSGHRRQEDGRTERQRGLIQKLYGIARGQGLAHLMNFDEIAKRYIPTQEFEANSVAHEAIHEFSDHLFWDELIDRLSFRDAALIAGGADRLRALGDRERGVIEGPVRQRYIAEFTRHGITNLELVERYEESDEMPVKTSD